MCGLAGFLSCSSSVPHSDWNVLLQDMGNAIRHRGPDDSGVWVDTDANIGLVHRRLSILDLSPAGHQPMLSPSERYVIVFNGEVYNHLEIRRDLEAKSRENSVSMQWRGHSDTETLLAGFDVWGIDNTIKKTVGMFAIAVWDKKNRTLTLARDRLGEKPLYYGWQGNTFLFGSELKSLKLHADFRGQIDRDALALLTRFNCIPAPHTIYKGIKKLIPGGILTVSLDQRESNVIRYWDARQVVADGLSKPFTGTSEDAVEQLNKVLSHAVGQQMVADVPLGAFLSGGIDSTTIVALMQAQSKQPVRTFTIGFAEEGYNEAEHAKVVAKHLGTDHTELYLSSQQAMEVIPKLPSLYCEPFSDSSQIPTFLVSQLARQHVTVSLSGDGGDELFGGYSRYFKTENLYNKISKLPSVASYLLPRLLNQISPEICSAILAPLKPYLKERFNADNIGFKKQLAADLLTESAIADTNLYRYLVSHWKRTSELVLGSEELPTLFSDTSLKPRTDNLFHQMMAIDLLTYLPDDILTKVDRAAMGVSLETRVPLLDHRVAEFAWSLPLNYKVKNGVGKWPLRQVLYKYVPKELMERPKMGFGVPIGEWLRGPLHGWAEGLLDESRIKQEGYFNSALIKEKWSQHLMGTHSWEYELWDVLMFQAWLSEQ